VPCFYAAAYILYGRGNVMIRRFLLSIAVILCVLFPAFTAEAQTDTQTPKEAEVIKYLRQGLVVFLCFHDAKDPNLDKIKADIRDVAYNFIGSVEAVYVSGDDKKEDSLRGKFKIQPNETAVFIVVPPGRGVAKLAGADITKTNLMKTLVSSCGGGGCGSGGGGCR